MCHQDVCTRLHGRDINGKICLRYLYNVENKNTCESLMISLFKNVPAKRLWWCQVKISLLEKAVNFCTRLNNDNTGHP